MSDSTKPCVVNLVKGKQSRCSELAKAFHQKYGEPPLFLARAPGRVNLIGEHIDYCGYSVLPMAIEQAICVAVSKRNDDILNIRNVDSTYGDFSTSIDRINIDSSKPQWHNYVLCGIKGVLEKAEIKNPTGMNIIVHGVVPQNAGLSSSSALVCVAGLATSHANGCDFTKTSLAEICMRCERYIGTVGGGMDQSISFLAESGVAQLISFNPIRAEKVLLPDNALFVIAHSCEELNKAATSHYNIRVAECKISVQILAKASGIDFMAVKTFFELQEKLSYSFPQMLDLIEKTLHPVTYTRHEVLEILRISDDELKSSLLSKNTLNEQSFELYKRSKHVLSEASRVGEFMKICNNAKEENKLQKLGDLMNASHFSCSNDYNCSCSALDELTDVCRSGGALGSRLTGAGWGGCCVSLLMKENVDNFKKHVKENYYDKHPEILNNYKIENILFSTEPGSGAKVFKF